MMFRLPEVLPPDEARQYRQALEAADWVDGRGTAGHQAMQAKDNQQLPSDSAIARQIGDRILDALGRNPQFIASALPLRVLPPRFNRYSGGGQYGQHIDSAVLAVPGTPHRVRTDLSATLFFSEPDEYDGGELVVEDTYGTHGVKLPAGHLVLYPGASLHRVTPVTRGTRYAAFFWVQSLVRDDGRRSLLLELDTAIQRLTLQLPDSADIPRLTGVYHNLLRQWSET